MTNTPPAAPTPTASAPFANEIALIESKTFWAALLAFLAVLAQQFHLSALYAWANDPQTVTNILNIVAMLSTVAAILFRKTASSKVTALISTDPSKTSAHGWLGLLLLPFLMGLGGCANSAATVSNINATTQSIGQLNTALIQLDATLIANTQQLAQQLATVNCPIINGAVALGTAINASPAVAAKVKTFLQSIGPVATTAATVCAVAGYTSTTPASAVPAAAVVASP